MATIRDHILQFCTAEIARSNTDVAFRSGEYQLQVVCVLESSLLEEGSRLRSDEIHLEEQCRLETRRGGSIRHALNSARETKCNLCENSRELIAQYDQELAALQ